MSMYDTFSTDKQSETEGVWVDYGQFRVRLARAGGANKNYQKQLERISRPYRRAIATDSLDPQVASGILKKTYAKAVITGWEVMRDDEFVSGIDQPDIDEPAPFNEENVLKALTDLDDLFLDLQSQASGIALYRAGLREDAAGN